MKITFIIQTLALFVTFMVYDSKAEQDDNKQLRMLVKAPCVPSPKAICSTTSTLSCQYQKNNDITICSTKTVNLAQLQNKNNQWSSHKDTTLALTSQEAGDQTSKSCPSSKYTQVSCISGATVMICTTNIQQCTDCTGTPVCVSTKTVQQTDINQPAQVVVPTQIIATPVITNPVLATPDITTPVTATPVIATPVIIDPKTEALKAKCSQANILTSQQQTTKDAVCLITGVALTSKQQKKCDSANKKLISYQLKQATTCAKVPSLP